MATKFVAACKTVWSCEVLAFLDIGLILLSRRVSRARRYPVADGAPTEHVRLRVTRVPFGEDILDPREIAIASLADARGLLAGIVDPPEFAEVRERIALVCRLDLIGLSVAAEVWRAECSRRSSVRSRPPRDSARRRDAVCRQRFRSSARFARFSHGAISRIGTNFSGPDITAG